MHLFSRGLIVWHATADAGISLTCGLNAHTTTTATQIRSGDSIIGTGAISAPVLFVFEGR